MGKPEYNTTGNYYDILGVGPRATSDEIARAYRHLALEHHPDRGGDALAMVDTNRAYEVLGDPAERSLYDEFLGLDAAPLPEEYGGPTSDREAVRPPEEPRLAVALARLVTWAADLAASAVIAFASSDTAPWLVGYAVILLVAGSMAKGLAARLRFP